MASRLTQQKPDPAIARNIRRARRGSTSEKAKGFVVAASLTATLMASALFAQTDARNAALEAAATATPVAATTTTQPAAAGVPASLISDLDGLWTSLSSAVTSLTTNSDGSTATTTSSVQSTASITSPAAVAITQSSR